MQEAPFAIAQAERSEADDEGNAVVDAATSEFGR
jgi:hypothetical protein